jgi:hypothetical protein
MPEPDSQTPSYTFANWRRCIEGIPAHVTIESVLFTDAWVTGEVRNIGPYDFLNPVATPSSPRTLRRGVVVRMSHHYNPTDPVYRIPIENDYDHYHGGDFLDEVAALASLFMGIRLKAGGVTREFGADGDPLGRPIEIGGKPDPQLVIERRVQIPRVCQSANLDESLKPLRMFPTVAVDEWASQTAPVDQLKVAFPKIAKVISESTCPTLLEPIAEELNRMTRAT